MRAAKMLLIAAPFMLGGCVAAGASQSPTPTQPIANGPVGLGQTAYVDGPSVTPLEVLEDSRCPKEVRCVWAGQVRLRVRVTGGAWSRELEVSTQKPVQVADGALQLVEVTPGRTQSNSGTPADYRFTFRFDGGY